MADSVESEAAALEDRVAGVGLDGRPDGEGAVVNQGYKETWVRGFCEGAQDKKCGSEKDKGTGSHFRKLCGWEWEIEWRVWLCFIGARYVMQTDVELPLLLVGSRTGFLLRKTEKTRLPLFVYDTLGFFLGFWVRALLSFCGTMYNVGQRLFLTHNVGQKLGTEKVNF